MKKLIASIFIIFYFFTLNSEAEIKTISEGKLDSKIKLIVFESLTCSHCADFHKNIYPKLKEDFIDKGYAYIEFRNFPLDIAALNASKIAHCKNDGNSKILHLLFSNQKNWVKGKTISDLNENLKKFVEKSKLNLNIDSCINNKQIEDHILMDRINGVKKFKIESTPTLIINGEKFENHTNYKKLKNYIEKLI
tara:strand:+ start:48 stop:626 length:579 start_codon:yes stop_codon:yes gene_type:complete